MEINLTEFIGYAASALVLLAFLMKNIRTLRIINSLGCILFVIYGVMLDSIPVIITNAAILLVNFYYLFIEKTTTEETKTS